MRRKQQSMTAQNEPIRVLIADDHAIFRRGLHTALEIAPTVQVIGEAGDGQQAVEMAESLQPDVILMDIHMPGMSGLEAVRLIHSTSPRIAIIMITMFDDADTIFAAMQAGARGYLLKGTAPDSLVETVRLVSEGHVILAPGVAERLINYFAVPKPAETAALFPELTRRENEILRLMADGLTDSHIAIRLGLSVKTVRNHVSNILNKLQVATRTQAVLRLKESLS